MDYDVFLSYSSNDWAMVEQLAAKLRKEGIKVFLDRLNLIPGKPWAESLENILNDCNTIAIVLGTGSMGAWQQRERDLALVRQAKNPDFLVIPVLLPKADPPLGFLALNHWVDFRSGLDNPSAFSILLASLRREPFDLEMTTQLNLSRNNICPYRGLSQFREEDKAFFFGRNTFTDQIFNKLKHPIIAVVGASGSGKSSSVLAGLIPKIRESFQEKNWLIIILIPGSNPLHSIAAAFLPLLEPLMGEVDRLNQIAKLADLFEKKKVSFKDIIIRIIELHHGIERVLLFIDQWEEIYTSNQDELLRKYFIDELINLQSLTYITIILALRGDFFGHAINYRPFADHLQGRVLNLGPMNKDELLLAIEAPAKRVQLEFESGLINRILNDLKDEPGNMPLLEFALKELWERKRGNLLTHSDYELIGEVGGAIAHRADREFEGFSPSDQEVVQKIFLQLVRVDGRDSETRCRLALKYIEQSALPILQKLTNARLLVTSNDPTTGEEILDLAHEALIQRWKKFQFWISRNREFLLWRQRFRIEVSEWENNLNDNSLLIQGTKLESALFWFNDHAKDFLPQEKAFLQFSIKKQKRQNLIRKSAILSLITLTFVSISITAIVYKEKNEVKKQKEKVDYQSYVANIIAASSNIESNEILGARQRLEACPKYLRNWEWNFLKVRADANILTLNGHKRSTEVVIYNSDNSIMASASEDSTIRIWNSLTGQIEKIFTNTTGAVNDIDIDSSGNKIVSGDKGGFISIWDISKNNKKTIEISSAPSFYGVTCVRFCSNNNQIILGTEILSIFDLQSEKIIKSFLNIKSNHVIKLCMNSDKSKIACLYTKPGKNADSKRTYWVSVIDLKSSDIISTWSSGEITLVGVCFGANSKNIFVSTYSQIANIDTYSGKLIKAYSTGYQINSITFDSTYGYLLLGGGINDRALHVWDISNSTELLKFQGHTSSINSIAVSKNGGQVVTGGSDNTIKIWNIINGGYLTLLNSRNKSSQNSYDKGYLSIVYGPKDTTIYAGGNHGVFGWDTRTLKEIFSLKLESTIVNSILVTPDGHNLIAAIQDFNNKVDGNQVQIWNIDSTASPKLIFTLLKLKARINSIAIDSAGQKIAIASGNFHLAFFDDPSEDNEDDDSIRIFDLRSKKLLHSLGGFKSLVTSVSFSHNGKMLTSSSGDNSVKIWNVKTGNLLANLTNEEGVRCTVFSPNDSFVVAGLSSGIIRAWHTGDFKKAYESFEQLRAINSINFSPDGNRIVACTDDQTIRILDGYSGILLLTIPTNAGFATGAQFSSDGKNITSISGADDNIRIWHSESLSKPFLSH